MDTTEEARRMAGLLKRGNRLWKVGTVGIIGMMMKIVKARRRQKQFNSPLCDVFHAPITYEWTLNLKVIKGARSLYFFIFADQILYQAGSFNLKSKSLLILLSGRQNEQLPYPCPYSSRAFIAFRASCNTRSEIHKDEFARLSNK